MIHILQGDCRKVLATMPAGSVHCVVTSPPYRGLRDYGVAGQIGLEPSPEAFVAEMVAVFREVWRVLRDDGTLWLNLGDTYASNGGTGTQGTRGQRFDRRHTQEQLLERRQFPEASIKPKDLIGIPWMVAFALRADGWYLRSDIIWSKPNPMPESTTDRPTSAHEHVFLFAKSGESLFWTHRDGGATRKQPEPDYRWIHKETGEERAEDPGGWPLWRRVNLWRGRDYFYDAEAVAEPSSPGSHARMSQDVEKQIGSFRANGGAKSNGPMKAVTKKMAGAGSGIKYNESYDAAVSLRLPTRNARNVWTIVTQPFSEAHFACVDEETECLTASGWKRHGELAVGDTAAQFDLNTGLLSWAAVQEVTRYSVTDQEMVVGSCRDLDMWLTPNHRTVIQRRYSRTRQKLAPTIIRADELRAGHSVPTAAVWDFDGDKSLSLEWAELLGWYAAEGHESKDSLAVELYQSETANAEKCRRIESLLRQVGAEWTKASARRSWRGREAISVAYRIMGYVAVRLRELTPGKRLPWGTTLWARDRIEALLDGLIDGDGHTRPDNRRCFVQKNMEQCGLVQALAMRVGLSANVSQRSDGIGVVYLTTHQSRSFRGTNGRGSAPDRRLYTGAVWCPRLPLGTWVARRNGKSFITGNTFPPELAERCIKAGTSERGCCSACGAPWRRRTERTAMIIDRSERTHAKGRTRTSGTMLEPPTSITTGWCPTCSCEAATVACTVLDPFAGAFTTALVADRLQRDGVGIELNPTYCEIARKRLLKDAPLLTEITQPRVRPRLFS